MASIKTIMPMSSAGIFGIGSSMELAGIKIGPKTVFLGAIIFILIVKIADKIFIAKLA